MNAVTVYEVNNRLQEIGALDQLAEAEAQTDPYLIKTDPDLHQVMELFWNGMVVMFVKDAYGKGGLSCIYFKQVSNDGLVSGDYLWSN